MHCSGILTLSGSSRQHPQSFTILSMYGRSSWTRPFWRRPPKSAAFHRKAAVALGNDNVATTDLLIFRSAIGRDRSCGCWCWFSGCCKFQDGRNAAPREVLCNPKRPFREPWPSGARESSLMGCATTAARDTQSCRQAEKRDLEKMS